MISLLSSYFFQATLILHKQCHTLLARASAEDAENSQAVLQKQDSNFENVTLRMLAQGDRPPLLRRTVIGRMIGNDPALRTPSRKKGRMHRHVV